MHTHPAMWNLFETLAFLYFFAEEQLKLSIGIYANIDLRVFQLCVELSHKLTWCQIVFS